MIKMRKHIYLDMDGVTANFYSLLSSWFKVQHWKEIKTRKEILEKLKGSSFFSEIPEFENTIQFYQLVDSMAKRNNASWSILSTPLQGDFDNSVKHKNIWLDRVFQKANVQAENRLFSHQKWKWSKKETVLVDDRPKNINDFIERGEGEGIRFQNGESKMPKFISKLQQFLENK